MKDIKDSRNPYHAPRTSERVGETAATLLTFALIIAVVLGVAIVTRKMYSDVPIPRHIAYPGESPRAIPRNGDIRMILEPSGDTTSLMYYRGQWYDLEEQSGSDFTNHPQGFKKL